MNKKSKTLLITMFFILTFAGSGASAAVLLDRIAAVVNNEVITWSELRSALALEGKGFLENIPEKGKEEAIRGLEKDYVFSLIEAKLQLQEARKTGLDIGPAEIDGAIEDIKKKFNLTDEALRNSLTAEGMNMEEYRTRLGEQILLSKVVNFEVRTNIVITDREIEEYYEANKDDLVSREKRRIRQIFFAAPKTGSGREAVEAKARDIIQRISAGEDFSKLASDFSEDRSRQFGGDLGHIVRGSALKEIEDAAFSLNTGEVSRPFWGPAGLHIIKLEEKVEAEGIEKVRDGIKEKLFQRAFESKYLMWKAGLKEKAFIEIKL
ncbi:MAG: peptidylprolyl isomerase [Nitrospirae bacterium]|nr:peptidylprolyl isomerase [Nitrospirota bacterium]